MPALPTDLRNKLEHAIIDARDVAEAGAKAALEALAVHHYEAYPHQKAEQRKLRVQLRAHAKQLGDIKDEKGRYSSISHLVHECAYEHWHRMLFARFLAENDLLIEPDSGMAVSLAEAEELAKAAKVDLWTYASRCAQQMLPQIFRPDDPLLQVGLANEHRVKLERLLAGLDPATFKADDSLGWVYQFWQSAEKDRVNASGDKITSDTLPAVTQLFTEHYMVLFLLHNTLGAWHAGKVLAANPKLAESAGSEDELRRAVALHGVNWEYLRFVRGADGNSGLWRPAAGTFADWPKTAALLKMLDPCCGSGHFLVAGFELLVRLRMAVEGLDLAHAVDAVLTGNLFGLELDARCTQIAAFNLALAAWKLAGHRKLPPMHIACTGIGPSGTMEEWVGFASKSSWRMKPLQKSLVEDGLKGMYQLFAQAPTLGSLIDPQHVGGTLITADYETLRPYIAEALHAELGDDLAHERAVAAAGMAKAAEILAGEYTLVVTNVPYLGRKLHNDPLKEWAEQYEYDARNDLATMFISRALRLLGRGGSLAVVTPQSWLLLKTYRQMRERLLKTQVWNSVARLGPGAFATIGGHIVNVALVTVSNVTPTQTDKLVGFDAVSAHSPGDKADVLRLGPIGLANQKEQLSNPDAVVSLESSSERSYLGEVAGCFQGISTGDDLLWRRQFWEMSNLGSHWQFLQGPSHGLGLFAGREDVVRADFIDSDDHTGVIRGREAWGKIGVAIDRVGALSRAAYYGDIFHSLSPVVVAKRLEDRAAVIAFCLSDEFKEKVESTDLGMNLSNGYLEKIPFTLSRWRQDSGTDISVVLSEPLTNDPTQWLFHGRPEASAAPLQVAVARLLGYRWPAELDDIMRLSPQAREFIKRCDELLAYADDDGIVCLPSVRGEEPAADRLLTLLTASGIKPDRDLDDWLHNDFFQEHCELFHHRPFVWHIWDGRKRDGFHALVNYHKLAAPKSGRKLLESLTYSYLGEWINRQNAGVKDGEDGAEDRLAAATELQKRLEAVLEGEPPYDLFVRWKPLAEQPLGWEPDINDGVRMNIRPFLASDLPNGRAGAGILRWKPNIKWDKDRGKEPERKKSKYPWFWGWDDATSEQKAGKQPFLGGKEFKGERFNACHYTVAAKLAARENSKKA